MAEPPHVPGSKSDNDFENTLAALIGAYETSHERIGRALHDDIGQVLSGVGLQLAVLRLDFKDVPGLAERTAELQKLLESAMGQVRELSTGLNPSIVERSGLHFALESLVSDSRGSFPGLIHLHHDPAIRLPRDAGASFYRIVKYAIDYAKRSATATQIEISVRDQAPVVSLAVRLDGAPHPPLAENSGARVELLTLQYHARKNGVSILIESCAQQGTMIRSGYSRQGGSDRL